MPSGLRVAKKGAFIKHYNSYDKQRTLVRCIKNPRIILYAGVFSEKTLYGTEVISF